MINFEYTDADISGLERLVKQDLPQLAISITKDQHELATGKLSDLRTLSSLE